MKSEIESLQWSRGEVMHRQITDQLRRMIITGELPAGERLPSAQELAQQWSTNYFTVHTALTALVKEGLLQRRRKLGTYVSERSTERRTIGVYFGGSITDGRPILAVYGKLDEELQRVLHRESRQTHNYVDSRIPELQGQPLPKLVEDTQEAKLSALIVARARRSEYHWLEKLAIPVVGFDVDFGRGAVFEDLYSFASQSVQFLVAQGCTRIGLISEAWTGRFRGGVNYLRFHEGFHDAVADSKLRARPSWVFTNKEHLKVDLSSDPEVFGYDSFKTLWAQAQRPDGIVVYTDVTALGVVRAAQELGVRLGADIKVVGHVNVENRWPSLSAIPQMGLSVKEVARELFAMATKLEAGEQVENVYVKPALLLP